jgi:hypothetical protein
MTRMIRTLTGFEPAPAGYGDNVYGQGDQILVGGDDWRYTHPVLGSHVGKRATVIRGSTGIGGAFVQVMLDEHPSVQFGMRREDIQPRLARAA